MFSIKNTGAKVIVGLLLVLGFVVAPSDRVHAVSANQYEPESLEEMIAYLYGIITQLQAQLDAQNGGTTSSAPTTKNSGRVTVSTLSTTNVSRSEATLRGEASTKSQGGQVWFEYGTDGDLDEDTAKKSFKANHRLTFSSTIEGLRSNTRYSYRVVLRENDGDYIYGQIKSFTTDRSGSSNSNASNDGDEPQVETTDVEDITRSSATVFGYIDMEDLDTGIAFFVYGRNENLVDDADSDYDEYDDINAPVNGFGKILYDRTFEGDDEISVDLQGLVSDSTYYYRACVQYEDNNDNAIICGDTEVFDSDN